MKELKYYVYVYLDPRKPGKYEYFDQGIGISFDYEPFYIGEGQKDRMHKHLDEAKNNNFEKVKNLNKYKIRKIRKIWKHNLKPIIYKIFEFENEQDALNVERTLGFLIGRYDQRRGSLTNQVDCGKKTTHPSEESLKKTKQYYIDDPNKKIREIKKAIETKDNKTKEEKEETVKKYKNTLIEDPMINTKRVEKRLKTENENPDIRQNAVIKYKKTLEDNPLINIEKGKKISNIKQNLSKDEKLIISKKQKESKILSASICGNKHPRYKAINYYLLIKLYFLYKNINTLVYNYNLLNDTNINYLKVRRCLKILNFPFNYLSLDDKKIKDDFIKENKDKTIWYTDNYERLEQEYFYKKHYEKYKEYFDQK
jgi:hypothetical protein